MTELVTCPPEIFPAVEVPLPTETARHAMVRALKEWFATLKFKRPDTRGPGVEGEPFVVKAPNILEEWPDPEKKLVYPSIAITEGTGVHETLGLTPIVDEASYNVYSPFTALVQLAEYAETLQITLWAADRGERRALLAGLVSAMNPVPNQYGFKLKVSREYFDRIATFQLVREQLIDGEETVRNVRRADLFVEARIPVVKLMPFRELDPRVELEVTEAVSSKVVNERGLVIVARCRT
jgi:hypothetical protein